MHLGANLKWPLCGALAVFAVLVVWIQSRTSRHANSALQPTIASAATAAARQPRETATPNSAPPAESPGTNLTTANGPTLSPQDIAFRDRVLAQHEYLLTHLPLSPAELEEMKDLIVERAFKIRSFPRDNSTEEGRRAAAEMYRKSNEPLEKYLGTERYQAAQKLVGQGMYRDMLVERYGGSMAAANAPLSPSQSDALAAVYADVVGTRKWNIRPDGPLDVDLESGLRPSDVAILDKAANVLSPEQLAILRSGFQAENYTSVQREVGTGRGGYP